MRTDPPPAAPANIDRMLEAAKGQYPGKPVFYISQEPDDNTFCVSLAERLGENKPTIRNKN